MEETSQRVVPVADPRRGVAAAEEEIVDAIRRVLSSGRYIHGFEHAAFENELAEYVGTEHCAGVACGTDALELALLSIGCRRGDEILTAANCGAYASVAARRVGLRPQYADVDPRTLCLSPATVQAGLGRDTRAVVVTHLYGRISDVDSIVDVCHERGVAVIEDCAQAIGAVWRGKRAGSFGDAAAFSFYPTKNLAAIGDAGAITTHRSDVAERVRQLRQYGWHGKYAISLPDGRNSRLDELQAAVLRVRLRYVNEQNQRRRSIVGNYAAALAPHAGSIVASDGAEFVGHLAVLLANRDRAQVRALLHAARVETDVHYPIADHQQRVWRDEYPQVRLPVTEHAVEHVLTLPCFPELGADEIATVCEALNGL